LIKQKTEMGFISGGGLYDRGTSKSEEKTKEEEELEDLNG
jgi:hypothetical protein